MRLESLKDILSQFPDKDDLWNNEDLFQIEKNILRKISAIENEKMSLSSLEFMTQQARICCLLDRPQDSEKILRSVKNELAHYSEADRKIVEIRYLLEQSRLFAIQMTPSKAIALANEAFELARKNQISFYAIDAAVLLSLISPLKKQTEILQWAFNECEVSNQTETKLWQPYLNVMKAWQAFDNKLYDQALSFFEKALEHCVLPYQNNYIYMIRWSIARTHRALGDFEKSFILQNELNLELEAKSKENGFVYLEMAESLLLQQKEQESKIFFEKAYLILSVNSWYLDNRETELERMKKIYKKKY